MITEVLLLTKSWIFDDKWKLSSLDYKGLSVWADAMWVVCVQGRRQVIWDPYTRAFVPSIVYTCTVYRFYSLIKPGAWHIKDN